MVNDKLQAIIRIAVPTPMQAFGSLLVAATILIWSYANVLVQKLTTSFGLTDSDFFHSLGSWTEWIAGVAVLDRTPIFLFWALVGIALYIIHYALSGAFINAYNLTVIETSYTGKPSAADLLKFAAPKIIAMAVFIIELILSFQVIFNIWSAWMGNWATATTLLAAGGWAMAAWIGLAVNIYIMWITFEIMHNS